MLFKHSPSALKKWGIFYPSLYLLNFQEVFFIKSQKNTLLFKNKYNNLLKKTLFFLRFYTTFLHKKTHYFFQPS